MWLVCSHASEALATFMPPACLDSLARCSMLVQVQELGPKLLQAALALHQQVVSTFRRTAVNFHYE